MGLLVRRFLLGITCLIVALVAMACSPGSRPGEQDRFDNCTTGSSRGEKESPVLLVLYFRDDSHPAGEGESEPLLRLTRPIAREGLTARATVQALITGPTQAEENGSAAGPVINASDLQIDDLYIQKGICVIHLSSPGPLPLYGDQGQSAAQAEAVLIRSLVCSLTESVPVEAVWVFQNGRPWEGETADWCCPLTPPGGGLDCKLYYCLEMLDQYQDMPRAETLEPVQIKLFPPAGVNPSRFMFQKIVDLLAEDFDETHRAPLPGGLRLLGSVLEEHRLTLDLAGSFPESTRRARTFAEALVYTFTELPEVDALLVTREGQPWHDDFMHWDLPLTRDDLKGNKPGLFGVNPEGASASDR